MEKENNVDKSVGSVAADPDNIENRKEAGREECFTDCGGRGYDDSIPGEVTKTTPSGVGLHDPLHGRQACPESNSYHQGVGQISPREGILLVSYPPKTGTNLLHPRPPQSLNDSGVQGIQGVCINYTSRESVFPLLRLIRDFRSKYH